MVFLWMFTMLYAASLVAVCCAHGCSEGASRL